MEILQLLLKCAVFELKILIFRIKLTYFFNRRRNVISAYEKLVFESNALILEKQKTLSQYGSRSMFVNEFFNEVDDGHKKRILSEFWAKNDRD